MEGETSWFSHCIDNFKNDSVELDPFLELNDKSSEEVADAVFVDLILPNDLLERILACLPVASIFMAGCVCKRWHAIVSSDRSLHNFSSLPLQKPWYFMLTSSDEPVGYAYDSVLQKWYGINLPYIEASSWFIALSCGLVCFMDNDSRSRLYVCNPITKMLQGARRAPRVRNF